MPVLTYQRSYKMKSIYEEVTSPTGTDFIKRTDEDGSIHLIPIDPSNSDYQAYLNPMEHLTEIIPADEA